MTTLSLSEKAADLRLFLKQILEPFRFIAHFRARAAARRQEDREHLIDLIDTLLARVEKIVEHTKEGSIAQAQSTAALAQTLGTWLEMFKTSSEEQAHLGSATVRPSDEHEAELERERQRLLKLGYPLNAPRAEQMQWLLENDEL